MHSGIERAKKYNPVFTSLDWHTIFRSARRNNPYMVVPMVHGDFYEMKQLSGKLMKKTSRCEDGSRLQWLKVKRFMYCKDKPGIIQYRYDNESAYKTITMFGASRYPKLPSKLINLYKDQLPISRSKYGDLCKLCKMKGLIPTKVRQWYIDLRHEPGVQDVTDEPAVEDSLDEENID